MFERKPDNFPTGPWKPILANKPHATVSLEQSLFTAPGEDGTAQCVSIRYYPNCLLTNMTSQV